MNTIPQHKVLELFASCSDSKDCKFRQKWEQCTAVFAGSILSASLVLQEVAATDVVGQRIWKSGQSTVEDKTREQHFKGMSFNGNWEDT